MTTSRQSQNNNATAPDWVADTLRDVPELATTKEAAAVLRVSRRTLARYVAAGRIRSVRHGGSCGSSRTLIPRLELVRYLSSLDGAA